MVPVAALALSLGLNSCTKDLDVEPIDPSKNTTVDAEKLLNKCYAEFTLEGYGPGSSELDLGDSGLSVLYRLMWNANELTTDEAICGWTDKGVADFDYNTYTSTNDCLYGLWWRLCLGVSLCNQYIQECSDYNPQMTAEAHFLRDLYYYYLLDNYGNPAYTEEVSSDNPVQISSAELFSKIVADLEANMGNMLPPSVRKKGEATGLRPRNMPQRLSTSLDAPSGWATTPPPTRVPTAATLLTRCCSWPTTTCRVPTTSRYLLSQPRVPPPLPGDRLHSSLLPHGTAT